MQEIFVLVLHTKIGKKAKLQYIYRCVFSGSSLSILTYIGYIVYQAVAMGVLVYTHALGCNTKRETVKVPL